MGFCFVIQPFDDPNNARFEQVFIPAIKDAGLDSYRVDRDPAATILIEAIEDQIKASEACLADITSDNPNVWYELGFALAAGKEVVLVCADGRRDRFPFDIQHRLVIMYKSESPSDFDQLKTAISARLRARLDQRAKMESVASGAIAAPQAGLNPQQLAALVVVAQRQDVDDGPSAYQVRSEMSNVGFTDIATMIAIRGLTRMGLVESYEGSDRNEEYTGYRATEKGLDWLEENQDKLSLRNAPARQVDEIDELPF
jgi:O-acetyl-ADP-ribose deacetylase (regulator of RNase III)